MDFPNLMLLELISLLSSCLLGHLSFGSAPCFPPHTHTLSQLCGVVTIAASLSSASPLPSVPKICQHPLQLIEAFALKDLGKVVWGGRASLMKSDLIKRYSCQCEHRAKTRRDKGEEAGESMRVVLHLMKHNH